MRDYSRELDIELKNLEEEILETREILKPEESLEEWERAYNRRREEIERKVDECFERFHERKEREKEEHKKKLSYRIPMTILKILVFFLIIGFTMVAGIYYLIMALIISWIVGRIFIKVL